MAASFVLDEASALGKLVLVMRSETKWPD